MASLIAHGRDAMTAPGRCIRPLRLARRAARRRNAPVTIRISDIVSASSFQARVSRPSCRPRKPLSSTKGSRSLGSSWSASGLGSLGLGRDGFDGRPPRCVLPSRRLPQPRAHSPRARTWLTASWRHPRSLRNPGRSTGFTDCMPPESPGIRQTSIRAMTKHQSENTSSAAARTSAQGVRAEQSERKRAAILKASKEVLAQGYAEFSLRKVAAAAGVRLSTVQHHFGDLESLILATIDSSTEEFMRYSRQLAQGQYESPTDDLKVFLDDAWTFVRNVNVRNLYLEVWAMGRHRPVVADSIKRIYTEYIQALILILRRINPTLTQTEAHTTATLISCLTEGAIVMAHWGSQDTPALGLLGIRLKAACLALVEPSDGCRGSI